ncbi:beta-ketoacyl synthase N-terminal-like domain-containing protein [Falsiroseomonas sp.]|uniref:beta-ketoacyl synthase N-terminal-like domain-containing protein n=1 Tax=Falsiroseomonas sp. TaxID=2870721 RepID=UPI003F708A93
MAEPRRVVITGLGVLAPGGVTDAAGFAEMLRAGRVAPLQDEWPGLAMRLGTIDAAALPRSAQRVARGGSRALIATLCVALAAFAEARVVQAAAFGVLVAGSNIAQARGFDTARKFQQEPAWTPPRHAAEVFDTHLAAVVAEAAGAQGPGLSVGGASASGNAAVAVAADLIAMGRMPGCLVVAPPPDFGPVEWQALAALGALAPPGAACLPFDRAAAGFVPGEGCGALVLESLESAQARGATPLAEIAGHAQAQQGRAGVAPDAGTALRVMRAALGDLPTASLGFVSAHATGTPAGDAAEAEALATLLQGAPVPVNATKAMIGHAIQGAALLELVACVLQLRGGFVHGTPGLTQPITDQLHLPTTTLMRQSHYALSPAYGFGGLATAVLLRNARNLA